MKVISGSLISASIALSLLASCSDNKSFSGSTPKGTSETKATNDAAPAVETPYSSTPAPVAIEMPAAEVETTNIFKDCDLTSSANFSAQLYKLPEGTNRLPNFPSQTPLKKICLKAIDIAPRHFTDGFPGVDMIEWFALNLQFNVKIATAGSYKFRINSDDGSKLLIDGTLVIDNDGTHGPVSKDATITLTAGSHAFNVQYFQGPREDIALELFWTPPGSSEVYLPAGIVSRGL